jgi:hypothetical protein
MKAQGQIQQYPTLAAPTVQLPNGTEEEVVAQALIDEYLRGDDLRDAKHGVGIIRIADDDISLMRAARQIASRMREGEVSRMSTLGRNLHPQRIKGAVLIHVIQSYAGAILPDYIREIDELLATFHDLIIEFVIRRIRGNGNLALYDWLQATDWPEDLRIGVTTCGENLWDVLEVTGLNAPDSEPSNLQSMLSGMASYYMLSYFTGIDRARIDVLRLKDVIERLNRYTMKLAG